ncbi:NACHT domain-containing protein [Pseudomonas alliivorans]|nr:NACHT domain-containing protein [Pseudomonas alliivorans]
MKPYDLRYVRICLKILLGATAHLKIANTEGKRNFMVIETAAVAGFIAKNLDKILTVAKSVYGDLDESARIVLKTAYKNYLSKTTEKYSKSKSFFIRNDPTHLYDYYVPIGIYGASNTLDEPGIESCEALSKRIIIAGSGGTGKSILMKHLFLDCINSGRYAPVMVELRDLNDSDLALDDFIEKTLADFSFNTTGNYIQKAKKAGHFCFFLDGYDEVLHARRKKLIKEIKLMSDKYSACPIFLSSRPDEVFNGLESFSVFHILPLTIEAATALVEKLPFDLETKQKFISALHEKLFHEHQSFLSNPLLLSIMLLTYGENSEIPSKLSIFYNQAFDALFRRHDAYKGGYNRVRATSLDIQDFSRVFSLFSLQTYDKREFKMSRTACLSYIDKSRKSLGKEFDPEDYLQDLLSAACLLTEEGLDVAFAHRSFQEYFVALHISSAAPEIQEKLIQRYWRNLRSDDVISLLMEINPELVERLLILPELDKLFMEIGVKRSVGITHAARHFKMNFATINFFKGRITASSRLSVATSFDLCPYALVYSGYTFPDDEFFEKFDKEMTRKYHSGLPHLETDQMTHLTPVLNDLLLSEGRFSVKYLQSVYDGYKLMKKKHSNRLESLDSLLGVI